MKKVLATLLFGFLLVGCQRPASVAPTATIAPIALPTSTPTELPPTLAPELTVVPPTETPEGEPTATAELQDTALPTVTQAPATATTAPTNTPGPTSTPAGPQIDPVSLWGSPAFNDPMTVSSQPNWVGQDGTLPDTLNIRLELKDDQLYVTGKRIGFSTWWFSWPFLDSAYVEMFVRTESCSGKDAYGLILRGPTRGAVKTHGYIVAFSCDGNYLLRRLDGTNPYQATDLIGWTPSVAIRSGSNQENRVGVLMDGSTFTIYGNRFEIARFTDSTYAQGRYGVFVAPSQTAGLTYRVEEINYWGLAP